MNPLFEMPASPCCSQRTKSKGWPLQRSAAMAAIALLLSTAGWSDEPTQGWMSFRGDPQLSGRASGQLSESLRPLWTVTDEDGFEATAAIVDGVVLIGSMGGVFRALDLAVGTEIWRFQAEAEIKSSALVEGGIVFFGDEAGVMYALDRKTGTQRWRYATDGGITSSPNRAGPCLLFGSYDNSLYCLDPETGE